MLTAEQITNWDNGVPTTARGPGAQTLKGKWFYPLNPDPEEIDLDDVCHQLALVNRFGGGTKYPYSVAQHLLLCRVMAEDLYPGDRAARCWALAHDLTEYMVGDIIRPVKRLLEPGYSEIETRLMWAFAAKLGLPSYDARTQDRVKHIDNLAAVIENRCLRGHDDWVGMPEYVSGYDHVVMPMPWWAARDALRSALMEEFRL
jgi:hypothetical protein